MNVNPWLLAAGSFCAALLRHGFEATMVASGGLFFRRWRRVLAFRVKGIILTFQHVGRIGRRSLHQEDFHP